MEMESRFASKAAWATVVVFACCLLAATASLFVGEASSKYVVETEVGSYSLTVISSTDEQGTELGNGLQGAPSGDVPSGPSAPEDLGPADGGEGAPAGSGLVEADDADPSLPSDSVESGREAGPDGGEPSEGEVPSEGA